MTTPAELLAARQAAGDAYAAAAQAYVDAWVTLHAYDIACGNRNVGLVHADHRSPQLPEVPPHPEFLPRGVREPGRPADRAMEMGVQLINSLQQDSKSK